MRATRLLTALLGALLLVPAAPAQDPFVQVPVTLPQGVEYEAVAPADYDGDGDLDLLVIRADAAFPSETTLSPELYRNDGVGADSGFVFTLVPFPAPPYPAPQEGGDPYGETLSWADYDNDGDVDALVATHAGTTLYRNDGGTFTDAGVPLPVYEEFWTFYMVEPRSSAWADYDNDGDLDLALPETAPGGPYPSPDSTKLVLYSNEAGTLVPSGTPFPLISRDLDLTWGDVENDGDLDLLYLSAGFPCNPAFNPEAGECVVIYENEGGTLAPRPLDFPQIEGGAADFGDFDLDGDLDVLLVASIDNPDGPPFLLDRAVVYRNDGDTFVADTLEFPFTFDEYFQKLTAGQWADYDSDGDVDILIGADVNDYGGPGVDYGGVAFVFANDGGEFTLTAALPASERFGTATWADLDGDGDLDFLATGRRVEDGVGVTFARLYRNDAAGQNRAPAPPSALAATPTADGVALSWGAASDDHTDADALTYNLHVQARAGSDIVSPMSRQSDGVRLLPEPGNVSLNTAWTLHGLPEGEYEWRVQAVDNAFNGGAFAEGGTFTVGEAALAVVAAPLDGPVAVPAAGGAFAFRASVTNTSAEPQSGYVWTEVILPNGHRYGPLFGPRALVLAPGQTLGPAVLRQAVPAAAPAGTYEYRVVVGRSASEVLASASFPVTKAAGAAVGLPARAGAESAAGAAGWNVEEVGGSLSSATGSAASSAPAAFAVSGAYPNPLRRAGALRLDLPEAADVSVAVYDVLGRRVFETAPQRRAAGSGQALALDVAGLPSGVYVWRVEAALPGRTERASGRLTVVR